MLAEPRRDEGAPPGAYMRCRTCGRRIAPARGACPVHGPVSGPSVDEDPAAIAAPLPRFPGFRTLHMVGRGGFGAVYAAEPEAGGARVAIKLARDDRPEAALRLGSTSCA